MTTGPLSSRTVPANAVPRCGDSSARGSLGWSRTRATPGGLATLTPVPRRCSLEAAASGLHPDSHGELLPLAAALRARLRPPRWAMVAPRRLTAQRRAPVSQRRRK